MPLAGRLVIRFSVFSMYVLIMAAAVSYDSGIWNILGTAGALLGLHLIALCHITPMRLWR
jgi:hypothetical protein